MAVLQQICIDEIPATPGGTGDQQVTRERANKGYLVMYLGSTGQGNRNQAAYVAPSVQLVSRGTPAATTQIRGVLLDYHNNRSCTIGRKGRFKVRMQAAVTDSDIGSAIIISDGTDGSPGVGKVAAKGTAFSVGEIMDYGTQVKRPDESLSADEVIGNYAIVDLNLPDNGPVS